MSCTGKPSGRCWAKVCTWCWFAILGGWAPDGIGADLLPEQTGPRQVAEQFPSADATWKEHEAFGFGGTAGGDWTYATMPGNDWSDYQAEWDVRLVEPAGRRDGLELTAYTRYHAMANLGGYEIAAIVRYESPDRHYRIALSSMWDEVLLWRPSGGVVQVQPFPLEQNQNYRVTVRCLGTRLTVWIDGTEVLDWWDRADPVRTGGIGIARKEGEAYVSRLRVDRLSSTEPGSIPAHVPDFREQLWHGERWFFDRREPVFVLTRNNVLDHMRFLPGYKPVMYAFNFATDWNKFHPTQVIASNVVESGRQLVLQTTAVDPKQKNSITSHVRLTVSYDPQRGMYQYDHRCTTQIDSPVDAEQVSPSWDHGDAVFLGGVGTAQSRDPAAYPSIWKWIFYRAADGKLYKIPLNPNFHYLGRNTTNGGRLLRPNGFVAAVGDPVLSPQIQIPELTADTSDVQAGVCWWGFDVHTLFTPKISAGKVAPGKYTTHVIYRAVGAEEGQRVFQQAEFFDPLDLTVQIPVFAAGVGFVETFDKMVLLASPHPEHRIWAGVLDSSVGHGDRSSLRLDGPTDAWTLTGPSYFTSPLGKKVVVSAWVKTKDVRGEGPALGFHRMDNNRGEFHGSQLTGTRDWTRIQYATTFPADVFGAHLFFRNSGSGTVWFDDVLIQPVEADAAAEVPPPTTWPLQAPDADMILHWSAEAGDASFLDRSGYGHHGKIYGPARWFDEAGRSVFELGGHTYVWPLVSPALTFAPPCTVVWEMKPQLAGTLISCGFQFTYRLVGGPEQFALEYEPAGGPRVISQPFLAAHQWQRWAMVLAADKISLYREGKLVEELAARPRAADWWLHTHSTWHRRMSFFGIGPGDMSLHREDSSYHLTGALRSLRVFRKALTAEELHAW